MSLSLEDFDKCCRWCLMKSSKLEPIFNACLHDIFLTIISLKMERNDSYPQQACRGCITKLSAAYNFYQMVMRSQKTLTAVLENCTLAAAQTTLINQRTEEQTQKNHQDKDRCSSTSSDSDGTAFIASDTRTTVEQQGLLGITDCVNRESDFTESLKFKDGLDVIQETFRTFDETLGYNELSLQNNDHDYFIQSEPQKNAVNHESDCMSDVDAPLTSIVGVQEKKCKVCQYTFVDRTKFEEHLLTHKVRCEVCYRMMYKHSLERHLQTHRKKIPKLFECNICKHRFTTKRSLHIHVTKLHVGKQSAFLCSYCGSRFKNESSLSRHKSLHTGRNIRICDICDKKFLTRHSIIEHLKSHESIKPYTCEGCKCGFTQLSSLRKHHRLLHAADGQYQCRVCEAVLASREALLKHKQTHRRRRCYRCKISFEDGSSLQAHNAKRHPNARKPGADSTRTRQKKRSGANTVLANTLAIEYWCWTCGQTFPALENLQEHSAHCSSTAQTPTLQCRMCPTAFTDSQDLVDHYSETHKSLSVIYGSEGQGHEILLAEPLLLKSFT